MHLPRVVFVAALVISAQTGHAEELARASRGHVATPPDRASTVVSGGFGVDGFIARGARDVIGPGLSWNVRVAIGSMADVRAELVYSGSSSPLNAMDGRLVGHGIHGLLRVNVTPKRSFETFFFMGGGWSRYELTTAVDGELAKPDHVIEMPFGGGIARRFGRLRVDARAGVSVITAADLIPLDDPATSESGESLHRFGIRANVGFEL